MAKKTAKCSESEKKKLYRQNELSHYTLILLIGIISSGVFMFSYSLIYLFVSLFETGNIWIGYLIGMIVSLVVSVVFLFILKKALNKKDELTNRMRKCKCKQNDKVLTLI